MTAASPMQAAVDMAESGELLTAPSELASSRIASIDALRGFVMFTMIYMNDIGGASREIVPSWMRHYQGRDGMTFVDLVFPAFLFIVGMSIPFALGSRIARRELWWKCLYHVFTRTLVLLFLGIIMVNGRPDSSVMGWSASLWSALMFLSAILWLGSISPVSQSGSSTNREWTFRIVSVILRLAGFVCLIWLAFAYRGENGGRIITLSPFSINARWYGILGLIGWAYLVSALVFLCFRSRRVALLGGMVLLLCLYPAGRTGTFERFPFARCFSIAETLGAHAAISVAGMLVASVLVGPETAAIRSRIRFTLLFVAGCSIGAFLLRGLYGISKNGATPSWCLWASAITAAIWLVLYLMCETRVGSCLIRPFAIGGRNVLLAYLLSNLLYPVLALFHLGDWYGHLAEPALVNAVGRSVGTAVIVLSLSVLLNRLGFRLKL